MKRLVAALNAELRDSAGRVTWLLFFRTAVAVVLLGIALAADFSDWPLGRMAYVLYAIAVASFLLVLLFSIALRLGFSPRLVAVFHLVTVLAASLFVTQATGGIDSLFSFFYLLAILDAAIAGGQATAFSMASAATGVYGAQLAFQLYGIGFGQVRPAPTSAFLTALLTHVAAFFFTGALAGHLAGQLRSAQRAAQTAQRHLRHIERLHELVLESLPVGVLTLDSEGFVRTTNRAATEILHRSQDQLLNLPAPAMVQELIREERGFADVSTMIAGKERLLSLTRTHFAAESVDPATAEMLHQIVLIEDQTETRELELSLRARDKLASVGELAAAIAHEIRNPLAALSGSIEMLKGTTDGKESRRTLYDIVLREVERLNRLVTDFLVYARPDEPKRSRVDVAAMVREVCRILGQDSSFAGITLAVIAAETVEASVDAAQIRQVLWNLVKNALEASSVGGAVEVEVRCDSNGSRPALTIEIRDQGSGIAPPIRQHLFEPFQTSKTNGTGLGLAVVHRIVHAHQGQISLDDNSPHGTICRVVLPDFGSQGSARAAP